MHIIFENTVSTDIGYPSTVELASGELLTVFYAKLDSNEPSKIIGQKWKIEK